MVNNLSPSDIALCRAKSSKNNQLLFGVMLLYFKRNLKFPDFELNEVSEALFSQVAENMNIAKINPAGFSYSVRTMERYRKEIRSYLGHRLCSRRDAEGLIDYLMVKLIPQNQPDRLLIEKSKFYLSENKIDFVDNKEIEGYIHIAKRKFEDSLCRSIFNQLEQTELTLIDQILSDSVELEVSFSELKRGISGARIKNIEGAICKINLLRQIKVPESIINAVNRKILLKYYDRIRAFAPSNIKDFQPIVKYASMAIFCHIRLEKMLDDLTDVFIKLIKKMRSRGENSVEQDIVKDIKRVGGKYDILAKLAITSVSKPKELIEEALYPVVPKTTLEEVIEDLQSRGNRWYQGKVQEKMQVLYAHGNRSGLMDIIKSLSFFAESCDYAPLIEAVEFIKKHWDESDSVCYTNIPPLVGVIPANWYNIVTRVEKEQLLVNKHYYELAVLEQMKKHLGFKAIWVEKSYRYRDPEQDLPKDFNSKRASYYKSLKLPQEPGEFISNLQSELTTSLSNFNKSIIDNKHVRVKKNKKGVSISLDSTGSQIEPENITKMQQEIARKWSSIHLIDILKESDIRTGFTDELIALGKYNKTAKSSLQKRLLLCIFAIGSNTGLKRISIANDDVSHSDLRYIKQRHINTANMREAIKAVVNEVLRVRESAIWGEATTTVACDSKHLYAWDQNLVSDWHYRYGKKGVMIYWHVDEKSLCIYSQLKNCSSSEVGSMIKGFIEHDTKMNMERAFVDTHGQSVIGFAVSYLLGFELCPRFKSIKKQKLYTVNASDNDKYQNISDILKSPINWRLIEENYDDIVKYIAALRSGIVTAEVFIKRLSNDNYSHPVHRALLEVGKAIKTIFLCKYLSSKEFRIIINAGLNVVERLNSVMNFIFYGKIGQISTNSPEDQELAILCLQLLQVSMVYINTLIIQEVLSQSHWQDKFTAEDYRALTPLFSGHINPYGLFPLDFSSRLKIGDEG